MSVGLSHLHGRYGEDRLRRRSRRLQIRRVGGLGYGTVSSATSRLGRRFEGGQYVYSFPFATAVQRSRRHASLINMAKAKTVHNSSLRVVES